jgi:2-iminobutanoate/2-iminopropanoate deaminase
MTVERFPSTLGSFSEAVATSGSGRWIHVSGMIGFGPDGKVVDGGVAAETAATFDAIEGILQPARARLEHIVRMTVFMTDLGD